MHMTHIKKKFNKGLSRIYIKQTNATTQHLQTIRQWGRSCHRVPYALNTQATPHQLEITKTLLQTGIAHPM
jgi:hypothetical protein